MLKIIEGSVFSTDAKTIVNTVNCVGALGKGIALEFYLRYEGLEAEYKKACEDKTLRIGRPKLYIHNDSRWILNFPTKNHWRYPSKLEWIEEALKYFAKNYKKVDFGTIAFPKLGCGNGKLDWKDVKPLMIKYLDNLDIDVYICLGETEYVDEIEKKMVNAMEKIDILYLQDIGIPKAQAELIKCNLPIKRMQELLNIKEIGKNSYVKLFRHFYKIYSNEYESQPEMTCQMNLFNNKSSNEE